MFAKLMERMARRQRLNTAQDMTDRDLSDLGVTRAQLLNFVKMPEDVLGRMGKMANVFGADLREIQNHRDSYLDAVEACHSCDAQKICRKTLAAQGPSRPRAEDIDFCPNAALYAASVQKLG